MFCNYLDCREIVKVYVSLKLVVVDNLCSHAANREAKCNKKTLPDARLLSEFYPRSEGQNANPLYISSTIQMITQLQFSSAYMIESM